MKILIIGSGGREHAIAWKLSQSPRVSKIFTAPGNAGTAALGENVAIDAIDTAALVRFARKAAIDFTVVGPDDALAWGVVDTFEDAGLRIFGPRAPAALLESSKVFARQFMRRHKIPSPSSHEFSNAMDAHAFCRSAKYPLVIKADGLALGKGVIIAHSPSSAAHAIYRIMDQRVFGPAGGRVVIEEFLTGRECSIHALVDGESHCLLPDCRDHKQAFNGNRGPNTGGMGTISPSGVLGPGLANRIRGEVLDPFLAGIKIEGIPFRGMLFPGLMIGDEGPKVLEFNCRWGDPETQVLVRRLKSDLLDLLEACVCGTLSSHHPVWDSRAAVCIVLASGGYPGAYEKGKPITGIEAAEACEGVVVFHAGTAACDEGIVTNGGRVLGVTALGDTPEAARNAAYAAAGKIHFANLHRRDDIGASI